MKKLSIREMKNRIQKGYYIYKTYDSFKGDYVYELCRDGNLGYSNGNHMIISEERALEWVEAGAELVEE